MADKITILTTANGQRLGKTFKGKDLVEQNFTMQKDFYCEERDVIDLISLYEVLSDIEQIQNKCVIRGKIIDASETILSRRKVNFSECNRHWCMIDIDSLPWDGPDDKEQMVVHAIRQLPREFYNVDCIYYFSSGMGIKEGIRLHLWFWLERKCSDQELKTWMAGCEVDFSLFNAVQPHLTANPKFIDGAVDPFPDRSGIYEAGKGIAEVPVPADLHEKVFKKKQKSKPRHKSKSGKYYPQDIEVNEETGLVENGREKLLFQISVSIASELVQTGKVPTEEELTYAIWDRFIQEADLEREHNGQPFSIEDARAKAVARLGEIERGEFTYVSRSDRAMLLPIEQDIDRPDLVSGPIAQQKLEVILSQFFDALNEGEAPRESIRITMGTGKTTQTIDHLKSYLVGKVGTNIEVYVPRHDLADEWCENLNGINAEIIHMRPRTGGQLNKDGVTYRHPILCERAEYVRDLEAKGHNIYSNACLDNAHGKQCKFFKKCEYLNQFRVPRDTFEAKNIVRIYTHASLMLTRNKYESLRLPDLVIIDETFISSALVNLPQIEHQKILTHIRTADKNDLGFELIECLKIHAGDLRYLRDKAITADDFLQVSLTSLLPELSLNMLNNVNRDVGDRKLHDALQSLIDYVAQDLTDENCSHFRQIVSIRGQTENSDEVVLCEHKNIRVLPTTPVLYLDATLDPIISDVYLPNMKHHRIDVTQKAAITQVYDRTGSNDSWNRRQRHEAENFGGEQYSADDNDLSKLIVVLNQWVDAGEKPLLVGHKRLADFLRVHPKLSKSVDVAHFGALRGSNAYENNSVIFITGRNHPPHGVFDYQARAIFANEADPLVHDDLDELATDQSPYWLSSRSSHKPSAIAHIAFSDPRIEAVKKQVVNAESVQAIARLRLVWAQYQKRVFLLSNLPLEIPVDHLVEFNELSPNRLELELLRSGNVPLTLQGFKKTKADWGMSDEAIKKMIRRDGANNLVVRLKMYPPLLKAMIQVATYKAGGKRTTSHQHLFLPKNYSGDPQVATYLPWTSFEIEAFISGQWGEGVISDLVCEYFVKGEAEIFSH